MPEYATRLPFSSINTDVQSDVSCDNDPRAACDQRLLAAIIESSGDAIISKTLEGVITSWNHAAERLFGYTREEIVGKNALVLFPPDRLKAEQAILDRVRQGIFTGPFDTLRLHKEGTPVLVSMTISPIRDAAGRVDGVSTVARRITRREQDEGGIDAANVLPLDRIAVRERQLSLKSGADDTTRMEKMHAYLNDLTRRLDVVTDVQEVLWTAVEAIGNYLGVSCHYAEIDARQEVATIHQEYHDSLPSLAGTHALASFGREMLEPLNHGRYVANEDTAADSRTALLYEAGYAPLQIRSFLAVPFVLEGRWVAHLAVCHSKPRVWDASEILLLQQVVERTARALYSARLQRELQHRVDETENLIQALPIGILDAYGQLEADTAIVKQQQAELQIKRAQLEEANRQLAELANTDGLTGLKNHRTFQDRIRNEAAHATRFNTPLSVLLLDIDNFKSYNDTFGHPAGDAALRAVAEILRETARATDVVTRYGGEEFAVILVGTDTDNARIAGERFRTAVEAAHWPNRQVTISVGVASLFATDVAELIESADKALYRSKKRGRNCVTHSMDVVSVTDTIEESLHEVRNAMVISWSLFLEMRDKETEGHSGRVADMMVRLARSAGMTDEEILHAKWGACLHDIGKIGVPDSILHKPGPLTTEEWGIMRQHPSVAFEMLSSILFLVGPALDIPRYHHERWDGTGYPSGLKGADIPLAARLFAVVDVYDALRSDRPYRKAWEEESVQKFLREQAGTHFDPEAVETFLAETW